MARGDFNGDGFADLALGVPFEDLTTRSTVGGTTPLPDAGAVIVIYGSADGLDASGSDAAVPAQLWHQNVTDVLDSAQAGDRFGAALAAGDFDGDDRSDLAIAIPGEDDGGAIHVLRGSDGGLTADDDYLMGGGVFGVPGELRPVALVWGNFDGDASGDLAVGSGVGGGRVLVRYGSVPAGLRSFQPPEQWSQDSEGVPGTPNSGDLFGSALAAGDFDGDHADDLAVGVPGEGDDQGGVEVIYGTSGPESFGLATDVRPAEFWHRNRTGVEGESGEGDRFGDALTAGDFDGNGHADLVVGAQYTDLRQPDGTVVVNAGAVNVIYGGPAGLDVDDTTPDQLWHQDTVEDGSAIEETAESLNEFGVALAAADFNGDGAEDLAVGSAESVGSIAGAGAVNVIYGSAEGLDASGDELFHQNSSGIQDEAGKGDQFGLSLSAWNFGNGAPADLAVGVPFEGVHTQSGTPMQAAGLVHVIYGRSGGGLDEDDDQIWTQETNGVPDSAEVGDLFGFVLY